MIAPFETVLQVSAGRGPEEVRRFVRLLAERLAAECAARGGRARVATGQGSATVHVYGVEVGDLLGTHALVAALRGRGARKRWFAGVSALPVTPELPALRLDEVRLRATRGSGAGGQHRNKTSTAIRAVHLPTGLAVRADARRSQGQNRKDALGRLADRLRAQADEVHDRAEEAAWNAHGRVERGAPRRTWRLVEGRLEAEGG